MTVKKMREEKYGTFFITITCVKWIPLIETTQLYDYIYQQFKILETEKHIIHGFVIMNDHFHFLISFRENGKKINHRIGTMKRFLAYEIIKRLNNNKEKIILKLKYLVKPNEKNLGKIHEIFEPSFDIKLCWSFKMIQIKLNYMHLNPCKGNYKSVDNPWDFEHSSAKFYFDRGPGIYPVTHFLDLKEIDLSKH